MNRSFTIYHPNAKGTGSALRFTLFPAHDEVDGAILLEFIPQVCVNRQNAYDPLKWDNPNPIKIKLAFDDICRMLSVFRGETECLDTYNPDKGLWHQKQDSIICFKMTHEVDPITGYKFSVYEQNRETQEERNCVFLMKYHEAHGVCEVMTQSLTQVVFGTPRVFTLN